MKKPELRANNLVGSLLKALPNNFFTVSEVGDTMKIYDAAGETHYFYIDDLEPIPLTEEWLIRFGFVKHDQGLFENIQMSYWAKDAVLLFFNGSLPENTYLLGFGFNDINQKYYAATMCWINSVHELQNAYHSMKQKDITISEPTKQ